ncbi:hypothetical protein [Brassicibacter mesophilus]|uniref:hypothetical protein n=1 Tax=Brassicibacter mesophilus TaxID=745119 RepID=UPI003D210E2C
MLKEKISVKEMDELQKEIGEQLKQHLESLNLKVEISYINLGYQVNRGYGVFIYNNKYDYVKIDINFNEEYGFEEHLGIILKLLGNEKCYYHKASLVERFIVDLLEEKGVKDIFVHDGQIYSDGLEEPLGIKYIHKFEYDEDRFVLTLNDDDYKYIIDLINEEIEVIEL